MWGTELMCREDEVPGECVLFDTGPAMSRAQCLNPGEGKAFLWSDCEY